MARYIDADALYKNLGFAEKCKDCDHQYNSVFCDSSTWQVVCDAIYEAPTIDAMPRWIPCEERLPEKENPYRRRDFYLTTNAYGVVNVTTYEFENDFQKRGWQSDIRIVAWMPLPNPYDGERKDDE